jgi:hypothetical protein
MKRLIWPSSSLILFLIIRVCNADRIMRISDRQFTAFSRMIVAIRGTRLIYIEPKTRPDDGSLVPVQDRQSI